MTAVAVVEYLKDPAERRAVARSAAAGDARARDRLVLAYQPLVRRVAAQFVRYGIPFDDLVQDGNVGLLWALRKYDPERGINFATYAVWWIRAEIQTATRRALVAPRTTRRDRVVMSRIGPVRSRLAGVLGREPTFEELGAGMGLTGADVERYLTKLLPVLEVVEDFSETGGYVARSAELAQDEAAGRSELLAWVLSVVVNEREREVLQRRFFRGDGLDEIAADWGVSKQRVGQVEIRALRRLREVVDRRGWAG